MNRSHKSISFLFLVLIANDRKCFHSFKFFLRDFLCNQNISAALLSLLFEILSIISRRLGIASIGQHLAQTITQAVQSLIKFLLRYCKFKCLLTLFENFSSTQVHIHIILRLCGCKQKILSTFAVYRINVSTLCQQLFISQNSLLFQRDPEVLFRSLQIDSPNQNNNKRCCHQQINY